MATLTAAQALAFINASEVDTLAGDKPCPDLLAWCAECRANPVTLAWEAALWDTYDGDTWQAATIVEYANGQHAVVVTGEGSRGVVMLADDRFYPVTGDPSGEWTFAMGDDHSGFETAAEAVTFNLES